MVSFEHFLQKQALRRWSLAALDHGCFGEAIAGGLAAPALPAEGTGTMCGLTQFVLRRDVSLDEAKELIQQLPDWVKPGNQASLLLLVVCFPWVAFSARMKVL